MNKNKSIKELILEINNIVNKECDYYSCLGYNKIKCPYYTICNKLDYLARKYEKTSN